jgi:PadR family transcriptional regulator PadR
MFFVFGRYTGRRTYVNSQLIKGIIDIYVLKFIKNNECYGYILVKHLIDYFPDTQPSTFYAVIRRLQNSNYIYKEKISGTLGPSKFYLYITPKGTEYMNTSLNTLKAHVNILDEFTK